MTPRPLDHVLPGSLLARWIRARARLRVQARTLAGAGARLWRAIAPWLGGAAIATAFSAAAGMMQAGDAELEAAAARAKASDLQHENERMRAALAEHAAGLANRGVFYVVEAHSLEEAADKLDEISMRVAGAAYDVSAPTPPIHEGRR